MTDLQPTYSLVSAAINSTPPAAVADGDQWRMLFALLQRNHVAALCAEAARAAGTPRAVLMPWLAEKEKAMLWQQHQREVQDEIVGTMARHGIETLVLKGLHTAQYYPQPTLREFADLDLYFYSRHDEADRVAQNELKATIGNDGHHHSKYDYRGVTVESHYDFVNTHYPPSNRSYEVLLKRLAPSATFEVLFLLRHMAVHFASSHITLRDLCDWVLTCRALAGQTDWNTVGQTAVEYGMGDFAAAIEDIAARQLGGQRLTGLEPAPRLADRMEQDIVMGCTASPGHEGDGISRLGWKLRRWRANGWKRRAALGDPPCRLAIASLASHAAKPRSIMHKV